MAARRKSNQGGMMKRLIGMICALTVVASVAFGGTETYTSSKEMKAVQGPPPCPEWYRDQEWDVSLWGTYAFTGTDWRDDRYLGFDHACAGGGAIFGGGGRNVTLFAPDGTIIAQSSRDNETKAVGQFGGGIEVRFTPTIGWMNDFSWNVVDGPKNNFGMVRSGITFAF